MQDELKENAAKISVLSRTKAVLKTKKDRIDQ